jgi:flagellar biosynthesis/type III secretory pathway M-ring protein FliF/YscJ
MPFLTDALAHWNALSAGARTAIAAGSAALVALFVCAGFLLHPVRTSLFATPLHPEQLAEVQERLAGWNVPFTPLPDNVVVDASRRNDVLLRLSLAGVPHAHVAGSDETLANVGVLTPEAVIDAQARAGLAGDVESGLRGIAGIDDARVIVAPAKTAEFADQSSREATASVRLQMRAGERLSRGTVAGIRAFVAAAVPALDPARVTIVDDRGIALSDDGTAGADDAAALQASLQSALDAAFGDGATIVRVHAEYGSAGSAEHDVRTSPIASAPARETAHRESFDDGGKRYRREDVADDRGSDVRETVSQSPAGALKRLSTAIFVDRSRSVELARVRELAAATVGFDARRGDTLSVEPIEFDRAPTARKDGWWLAYGVLVPLLPALAIGIGVAAAARHGVPPLAAVAQKLVERASLERTAKNVAGLAPSRVRSALAHEPPHAAAAVISALPAATAAAVLELYPAHERDAIVQRMQRPNAPILHDAADLLTRHA